MFMCVYVCVCELVYVSDTYLVDTTGEYIQPIMSILSTSNRIPTGSSSKKGCHVYFLLIVDMVLLL